MCAMLFGQDVGVSTNTNDYCVHSAPHEMYAAYFTSVHLLLTCSAYLNLFKLIKNGPATSKTVELGMDPLTAVAKPPPGPGSSA